MATANRRRYRGPCSEAPASEHTALEAPASTVDRGGRSLRAVRSRAGALERDIE